MEEAGGLEDRKTWTVEQSQLVISWFCKSWRWLYRMRMRMKEKWRRWNNVRRSEECGPSGFGIRVWLANDAQLGLCRDAHRESGDNRWGHPKGAVHSSSNDKCAGNLRLLRSLRHLESIHSRDPSEDNDILLSFQVFDGRTLLRQYLLNLPFYRFKHFTSELRNIKSLVFYYSDHLQIFIPIVFSNAPFLLCIT